MHKKLHIALALVENEKETNRKYEEVQEPKETEKKVCATVLSEIRFCQA